jgi:hypothetical protein
MKGIKLSKISWLILSAGLFLVILVSLGVTRSGQLKEQNRLEEELSISTARVEKIETTDMRPELDEALRRVDEAKSQRDEAAQRLNQMIESVDVTDKFFAIAGHNNIQVNTLSNTQLSSESVNGVNCATISIGASVSGDISDIMDFIISLNDGYTTGYVQSVQINTSVETSDNNTPTPTTANLYMVIYSYEGK